MNGLFRRRGFWYLSLAGLALAVAAVVFIGRGPFSYRAMAMAAGVGAKLACSGVYVAGRDPESVIARDLRPFHAPLLKYVRFELDPDRRTATAAAFGLVRRTALYRPGAGCTLLADGATEEQLLAQERMEKPGRAGRAAERWPDASTAPAGVDAARLERAVSAAFDGGNPRDTRAVVVLHGGSLVAERYAEDYDRQSRFLVWSAAKSVTSALIGTLVTDGRLELQAPAPVPEWSADGDPRRRITLHQLLTMTSGLAFEEAYLPGNDSTEMLFGSGDMGGFAADKPLRSEPGSNWAYSSGTTNLLSRILFDAAGGSLASVQEYMQRRLFGPLGMRRALFEHDASGVPVGSSYFYASARDMARFGQLYLHGGRAGGRQLLSEDWVVYSRTPVDAAPRGQYGAQFWLNAGSPGDAGDRLLPDCPPDLYMAAGHNGQYIAIVPSRDAVVVRLGWTNTAEDFDINGFVAGVLDALPDAKTAHGV